MQYFCYTETVDVLRKGWNVMELTIVETARTRDIVKIVLSSIYTREKEDIANQREIKCSILYE